MIAAGKQAWKTRLANLRKKKRKSRKGKGKVVGFYKDSGKTKPITKPIAQIKRKKVVQKGRKFGVIKPKKEKWMQKAKVKEGALKKYGYDPNSSPEARHKALTTCVNAEGFQVCRSRIQLLVNVAPDGSRLDRIYKQDLSFLDGMKTERSQRWKKILKKAGQRKTKSGYKVMGTFSSSSTPGKKYTVLQGPKGGLSCNCPRFIFKRRGEERSCRHVQEVQTRLARKQR
jgi:hypothetical protein